MRYAGIVSAVYLSFILVTLIDLSLVAAADNQWPNVLLIAIDDLFCDISTYGHMISSDAESGSIDRTFGRFGPRLLWKT